MELASQGAKVAGFLWNQWSLWSGIGGRFRPERVTDLGRNMHVSPALLVASLTGLVLSSTGEEFVFRGALQPLANQFLEGRFKLGLLQIRWGTLAVAALFGLTHLVAGRVPPGVPVRAWRVPQTISGFTYGLIFGQVHDHLETVWVPAFLHILANLALNLVF